MPVLTSVLAPSEDLAGAYVAQFVQGQPPVKRLENDDYLLAVASSYVRADFNHDGRMDLAIIIEAAPGTSGDKATVFGERTLKIYMADSSGNLKLIDQSGKAVLRADAGGTMGDPNGGLALTKKGSLAIRNNGGGGNDSWDVQEILKIESDHVLLVGRQDRDYNVEKNTTVTTDIDLITGKKIETTEKGRTSQARTSHVPVKPLLRLGQIPDLY